MVVLTLLDAAGTTYSRLRRAFGMQNHAPHMSYWQKSLMNRSYSAVPGGEWWLTKPDSPFGRSDQLGLMNRPYMYWQLILAGGSV